MRKVKSFSHYGNYLEVKNNKKTSLDKLMQISERAKERPLIVNQPKPKVIEGFDKSTGRNAKNGFQLSNIRDQNSQTNYLPNQHLIHQNNANYSMRKQKEPRLKHLIAVSQKYQKQPHLCPKAPILTRNQAILTSRDLQNARKTFHSIDFNKQITKSHSYIKKSFYKDTLLNQEQSLIVKKDPLNNTHSIHSFNSYPKRDFLSQKKLSLQVGSPLSGVQAYKIRQQKYKVGWKVPESRKFEQYPSKSLNRHDGEKSWFAKLEYKPKEEILKKHSSILNIENSSSRKANEVHSKYPFRIAI